MNRYMGMATGYRPESGTCKVIMVRAGQDVPCTRLAVLQDHCRRHAGIPRDAHVHLGQVYTLRPDSADTVRCPFCGQERKA